MEGAVSMRYRVERPSYLKVCLPLTVPSDSHAQTPQLRRTKPFFASDGTETTQSSGITNFGFVLSREHGFGRLSSMLWYRASPSRTPPPRRPSVGMSGPCDVCGDQ
jgi:hypothetical protein